MALRTRSSYRMGSAIVYHHLQTKRQRAPCFWSSLLPTRRSITQRISTGSASSGIVCSWQPESAGRYVVLGQKQGYRNEATLPYVCRSLINTGLKPVCAPKNKRCWQSLGCPRGTWRQAGSLSVHYVRTSGRPGRLTRYVT